MHWTWHSRLWLYEIHSLRFSNQQNYEVFEISHINNFTSVNPDCTITFAWSEGIIGVKNFGPADFRNYANISYPSAQPKWCIFEIL